MRDDHQVLPCPQEPDILPSPSRRRAMRGGIAALAAMMLAGRQAAAATPGTAAYAHDPRHGVAQLLADLVIPTTDTPGAAAVDAGGFVLFALDHQMSGLSPALLTHVHTHLDAAAHGPFEHLPRARQEALLDALDAAAYAATPAPGTVEADWRHLKKAILAGYYTSEVGASQELRFEPVPGERRENITIGPDYRMPSNAGFGGLV